jgi:hypothetical protein
MVSSPPTIPDPVLLCCNPAHLSVQLAAIHDLMHLEALLPLRPMARTQSYGYDT